MEPQVLEVETVLYVPISDHKCNLKKTHLVVITFGVNFVYTGYLNINCVYVARVPLLEQSLKIKDMAI